VPETKVIDAVDSKGQAIDQKRAKFKRVFLKSGDELKSGDLIEVELGIDSKNDYEYLSNNNGKNKIIKVNDNKLIGLNNKYSSEQFQSTDYKSNHLDFSGGDPILPNASNLLFLIKSEYVDDQYKFNISNKPVTTRTSNRNTIEQDNKYLHKIKRNIDGWNELFYKYFQTNNKLLSVKELKINIYNGNIK
jgi:hypothetical protein